MGVVPSSSSAAAASSIAGSWPAASGAGVGSTSEPSPAGGCSVASASGAAGRAHGVLQLPEQAALAAHAPAVAVPRAGPVRPPACVRGDHGLQRPRARDLRAPLAVLVPAPREARVRSVGAQPPAVVPDLSASGRAAPTSRAASLAASAACCASNTSRISAAEVRSPYTLPAASRVVQAPEVVAGERGAAPGRAIHVLVGSPAGPKDECRVLAGRAARRRDRDLRRAQLPHAVVVGVVLPDLQGGALLVVVVVVEPPPVVLADEGAGAITHAPRVPLGVAPRVPLGVARWNPGALEHLEEGGGSVVPTGGVAGATPGAVIGPGVVTRASDGGAPVAAAAAPLPPPVLVSSERGGPYRRCRRRLRDEWTVTSGAVW